MAKLNIRDLLTKVKKAWGKSRVKEEFDKKDTGKKSGIIKIVVSAVLIILLIIVMKNREEQNTEEIFPSAPGEVDLGMDTKVLQKSWYAKANDELTRQDKRLSELEQRMKTVLGEVEEKTEGFQNTFEKEFDASLKQLKAEKEKSRADKGPLKSEEKGNTDTGKDKSISADKAMQETPQPMTAENLPVKKAYPEQPVNTGKASAQNPQSGIQSGNRTHTGQKDKPPAFTNLIHMDIEKASFMDKEKTGKKEQASVIPIKDVIPVGSFFKCTLLTGVDAATGLKAQSQPQPVLLKINTLTTLPNEFQQDVRQCHITGEAYGSLSEERAYIRVNNLSCIKKSGQIINSEIRGFVTGEDGSLGLRGRMVSKKGVFLARSIVASFVEGISKAFSAAGTTTSAVWGGTEKTVSPQDAFQVGFGEGMSSAMSDLAKSYTDMAKETFPVIEISSGRQVHVVTVGETDLTAKQRLFSK
ncbi:Type IV secretion system protein VirB10/TraB/TrbI domain-containing protein [Desulfonema limicola]|uniref:Type IV secretion system protein VirB10/TraB/TrbI domain-containing protein n=1 Tax=Desulfonema limicola TaxID=45656 RepID=A0A975B438_9BACT|nr:TrbI/VirB10 family protein [Desulfonema limicola]QTA78452.1 Type IV secretion system protein VirB10/TraB/TrbI domain-containing protein [Desulfonema limicola]